MVWVEYPTDAYRSCNYLYVTSFQTMVLYLSGNWVPEYQCDEWTMSTVLLIGEDDLLLQTRAAVLRTTGAETVCSKAISALAIQADQLCDLVILCHTLPELLCAGLAETIHARWPRTAILLVTPTRAWESPYSDEAISAITSADPLRLIARTIELLSQRKSNSLDPQELPR